MIRKINGKPAAMLMADNDSGTGGFNPPAFNPPAWDDIAPVKVDDVQTGRNIYIETVIKNEIVMTKASAGRIIQCIKEGFMPVSKLITEDSDAGATYWYTGKVTLVESNNGQFEIYLPKYSQEEHLYSDPNGDLSKPFTSIEPEDTESEGEQS